MNWLNRVSTHGIRRYQEGWSSGFVLGMLCCLALFLAVMTISHWWHSRYYWIDGEAMPKKRPVTLVVKAEGRAE